MLKVTISSPTLAQGLNLSASTLVFFGLERNRNEIDIAEFRNVVGRAGRAYVDVEGLALYPMFDRVAERGNVWKEMIASAKGKEMESGLLRLVLTLLLRMIQKHKITNVDAMIAYLAGNAAWEFPVLPYESDNIEKVERGRWSGLLTTLDTAILSMLGEREVADVDIEATLDEVLNSSLWSRRLMERTENVRRILTAGLTARTRYIWTRTSVSQRRGYFLAGVGLGTGEELDKQATELNELLISANGAILMLDYEAAIVSITAFASKAFLIDPFSPDDLPDDWRGVLSAWLRGDAIATLATAQEDEVLQFVEQALVYRLSWAMEAVRVRAIANKDKIGDGFEMGDFDLGLAVAAVETGTLNRSAAILIRAGFGSRIAAIKAVTDTGAVFQNTGELRAWLRSRDVVNHALNPNWPTPQSHGVWLKFIEDLAPARWQSWKRHEEKVAVEWDDRGVETGNPVRLFDEEDHTLVLYPDFARTGRLKVSLNPNRMGLVRATVAEDKNFLHVVYLGPDDLKLNQKT